MRNELVTANIPGGSILIDCHSSRGEKNRVLCDMHYHDEVELLSITEGSLLILVNGIQHPCKKGDIIFFSPRVPHATYYNGDSCSYTLVQFRPEHFLGDSNNTGKYFNRFLRNAELPYKIIHSRPLSELIAHALEEHREQAQAFDLSVKGMIYTMIAYLCREGVLSAENSDYSADISKILPSLAYIEENYVRDLTLDEVAGVQGLNPSYFCRIFKKASGSGFVDYLNFVRVCKSEKLLAVSDRSVLEVAYEVGFSSVSYFNRIFKRYKNCTPTEYRRAQYENR